MGLVHPDTKSHFIDFILALMAVSVVLTEHRSLDDMIRAGLRRDRDFAAIHEAIVAACVCLGEATIGGNPMTAILEACLTPGEPPRYLRDFVLGFNFTKLHMPIAPLSVQLSFNQAGVSERHVGSLEHAQLAGSHAVVLLPIAFLLCFEKVKG